ncbi:MAG: hypothetical protein M0042_15555 [Nitrospiraceae bacterium]|nr:hypothetical protein [Nitrospiraceae bacterium]
MKKLFAVLAVLFAAAVIMTGCGGGGGGTTGGGVATAPSTTSQAKQAASSGSQGVNMAAGSSTTFQNFGQVGLSSVGAPSFKLAKKNVNDAGLSKTARLSGKFAKAKSVAKAMAAMKKAKTMKAATTIPSTTGSCVDSGSYTYSGSYDSVAGSVSITMTFANCREDGLEMNGTMKMDGTETASNFTITETIGTAAAKFTMLEFGDYSYTMLVSKMEAAITMGMSGDYNTTSGAITGDYTVNGTMSVLDYVTTNTYSMTYSNNKITLTLTPGTTSTFAEKLDMQVDGSFSESWTEGTTNYGVSMSYSAFKITDTVMNDGSVTESLSGSFTIDFTPDQCFEGTYSFETVTPIKYNANGMTIAGEIVVNTSTHIVFNSDGTITVTLVNNGQTTTVANHIDPYDLAQTCEFQTLDEPAPTSSGNTGTAKASSMTITSLSSDTTGSLDCYTDLHVNYYSVSAPTSSTTGSWYVDWHVNDGSTLPSTDPGASFQQYLDITGDGVADVGLDINGSEYDNTSGGLEHFTALKVPAGYYVISMNNFSCPGTVTNNVTIQIGSDSFGPYNCTYTTSDGEGTTPGAWCAVADIAVDSAGTATVKAHDVNLQLWHDGAFGMYTPSISKARKK